MGIPDSEREGCRTVSQHGKTTYDHDDGRSTMVTHNSRWERKEENTAICTLDSKLRCPQGHRNYDEIWRFLSPGVEPRISVYRRLVLATLPRVRDIRSDISHPWQICNFLVQSRDQLCKQDIQISPLLLPQWVAHIFLNFYYDITTWRSRRLLMFDSLTYVAT